MPLRVKSKKFGMWSLSIVIGNFEPKTLKSYVVRAKVINIVIKGKSYKRVLYRK